MSRCGWASPQPRSGGRALRLLAVLGLLAVVSGCATPQEPKIAITRKFDFRRDTFAYSNDLIWEYYFDEKGDWVHRRRQPRPDYTHHCFVVARTARQFFLNARFEPSQPVADEHTYRRLIREVATSNPRKASTEEQKIIIPGYADLRSFSQAQEKLLKAECGGIWQSYIQRGHWRMIFPFSRHHQEQMAQQLLEHLESDPPLVVHIVRFPSLWINHSIVVYGAEQTKDEILFSVYDPYNPREPTILTYNRATRTFSFPENDYWFGGTLDAYETYYKWDY